MARLADGIIVGSAIVKIIGELGEGAVNECGKYIVRLQYGELYKRNYYKEVKEKNRIHYELYSLDGTQEVPEDYKEISLLCKKRWNVSGNGCTFQHV